jgi:hypothetical protein
VDVTAGFGRTEDSRTSTDRLENRDCRTTLRVAGSGVSPPIRVKEFYRCAPSA